MPARDAPTGQAPAPGGSLRTLGEAIRLHRSGRLDDAEAAYAAALRDDPDDVTALINAGALAIARGDATAAIARLERAVARVPRNAIAHGNLGFARLLAQRDDDALQSLDTAVRLDPAHAQAHNNRGIALSRLGRRDEALAAFERAFALDPASIDAACNAGELLARSGDGEAARARFAAALAVDPGHVRARTGHALATALTGDLPGARAALASVVAAHPAAREAWKLLGVTSNWAWDHAAAEQAFARVLDTAPDDAEASFGVASTLLARGRYVEGFRAFERRPDVLAMPRAPFADRPAWDGGRLAGTLLLVGEQGLGDVVQFVRFAARARERVARIVLLLEGYWSPLAPLLAGVAGIDAVHTTAASIDGAAIGARASVLSLPHLLGVTPDSLDAAPYLDVPPARKAAWSTRLSGVARPRVGLAWSVFARGDYGYVTRHKSIPADALAPLLDVPGVQFVTLQPGASGDPAALGRRGARLIDPRAELTDFAATAALITTLDLVIAPDTAVAHVAGALGAPVWMLDRFNSCWRWRLADDRTPWYPSMRIFRQQRFGDWSAPVARATGALRALAPPPRR
jgi:tetratricopeptide (TPR) repeat protein